MEYVSKYVLLGLIAKADNEERKYILNYLLTSYKFEQWQTIDEFKENTVNGICFVNHKRRGVLGCFYKKDCFHRGDYIIDTNFITHVMPIKTPEAPK